MESITIKWNREEHQIKRKLIDRRGAISKQNKSGGEKRKNRKVVETPEIRLFAKRKYIYTVAGNTDRGDANRSGFSLLVSMSQMFHFDVPAKNRRESHFFSQWFFFSSSPSSCHPFTSTQEHRALFADRVQVLFRDLKMSSSPGPICEEPPSMINGDC